MSDGVLFATDGRTGMIGALILLQLIGVNSEVKKQNYILNPDSSRAFEYLVIYGLIGMFVWPVKFGVRVWREGHKFISIFYFFMATTMLLALPILFFASAFIASIVMFFVEESKLRTATPQKRTPISRKRKVRVYESS